MTLRTAAQFALEAMEEWDNYLGNIDFSKEMTALRQALEQADERSLFDCGTYVGSHIGREIKHNIDGPQPAAQWVGLTLKDMPDNKFGRPEWLEGVNWAEAKLKEKNT